MAQARLRRRLGVRVRVRVRVACAKVLRTSSCSMKKAEASGEYRQRSSGAAHCLHAWLG